MKRRKWRVWQGDNCDQVIFEGSHTACLRYYKQRGGAKMGLHIGYEI